MDLHFVGLPATDVSWFIVQADNDVTGETNHGTTETDDIDYSAAEFCWSGAVAGNGAMAGMQAGGRRGRSL